MRWLDAMIYCIRHKKVTPSNLIQSKLKVAMLICSLRPATGQYKVRVQCKSALKRTKNGDSIEHVIQQVIFPHFKNTFSAHNKISHQ